MKRLAVVALLLLSGCQGNEARYDTAAKAKARAVAPTIASYGELVSVGQARERAECSEARPFVAGRCLDVMVTRRIPGIDSSGRTIMFDDKTHVFTWLERRGREWAVTHTAQWNPDLVLRVESSYPADGDSWDLPAMPPAWMYSPYVPQQQPLPASAAR